MEGTEAVSSGGNTTGASAPATFEQAFATPAASPAAEPAPQNTTPPAAAVPGSEQAASPQQADRSPFIPRERFDEVVTARQRAEQALSEWKQYEWARNPQVQQIVQQVAASQGDPLRFFAQQFQELSSHPVYGPQLRTFLGQQFGALRQRGPTGPPEPDIVVRDEHGQQVGMTYSHERLAERDAYLKQQLLGEVTQTLAPKLQTLDQLAAKHERDAATAQANAFASSFMDELKALPGFDLAKHGPAIAQELSGLNLSPDAHPAEVSNAAYRAYVKHVLPTLSASAQSRLLDNLQQKAAASTAVNPASAAGGSRAKVNSFYDKSLVWK